METSARQEIEYLRRLYAKATDMIGTNTKSAVEEGRAIYRRIFTRDAMVRAGSQADGVLERQGPDGWVDVVTEALDKYSSTQHLIGTQVVDIDRIEVGDDGTVTSGEASMESYLQAWHEDKPGGTVWVFIGTYHDKVRYTPGVGWQIYDMTLTQVAGENRALGAL